MTSASESALPRPWRACRGGRVLAANGVTVCLCSDRRQAREVIRQVEPLLRDLCPDLAGVPSSPSGPRCLTGTDQIFQMEIGAVVHTFAVEIITAAAVAAAINSSVATYAQGITASAEGSRVCVQLPNVLRGVAVSVALAP